MYGSMYVLRRKPRRPRCPRSLIIHIITWSVHCMDHRMDRTIACIVAQKTSYDLCGGVRRGIAEWWMRWSRRGWSLPFAQASQSHLRQALLSFLPVLNGWHDKLLLDTGYLPATAITTIPASKFACLPRAGHNLWGFSYVQPKE